MKQLFSNNIDTALADGISNSATSMTVANAAGLSSPSGGNFELLTLAGDAGEVEIVRVTGRASAVLTVARAQEGTTARTWPAGARVIGATTAGTLARKLENQATATLAMAVGNGASAGSDYACAFGNDATAAGELSLSYGNGASAVGMHAISIGNYSQAYNHDSITIGAASESYAHGGFSGPGTHGNIILGFYATTSADGSILIGHDSAVDRQYCVAIGHEVRARPRYGVVIGAYAETDGYESPSSEGMVAIGYETAIGEGSFGAISVGAATQIGTSAPGAIAIGYEAQVANSALLGIALGSIAVSTPRTMHTAALPAVPKKQGTLTTSDAAWAMVAPMSVIMSDEVDLKATGDVTAPIWAGLRFFPDECGLVITEASGVTGQPTVRFGTTGTLDKYLAATATTGLDAAHERARFKTLASDDGASSLTAGVTVAATGTTLKGRFYWRGWAAVNT